MRSITAVTPTLCALLGIDPPVLSEREPLAEVIEAARAQGVERVQRALVFAPDAIGAALVRDYEPLFAGIWPYLPVRLPLRSVFPPKTPVCFASMFTGAPPEAHGIRQYERPVLRCDTLMDALIRARKRVALVAVSNSSMDLIFRERDLDYFSERYDAEVLERALSLLAQDRHDVLLVYQQEYDDMLHKTTPRSPAAIQAAEHHVRSFLQLAEAAERHWTQYDRVLLFTPDHGGHVDPATGQGTHGEDIAEDMEVVHGFGVRRKTKRSPR